MLSPAVSPPARRIKTEEIAGRYIKQEGATSERGSSPASSNASGGAGVRPGPAYEDDLEIVKIQTQDERLALAKAAAARCGEVCDLTMDEEEHRDGPTHGGADAGIDAEAEAEYEKQVWPDASGLHCAHANVTSAEHTRHSGPRFDVSVPADEPESLPINGRPLTFPELQSYACHSDALEKLIQCASSTRLLLVSGRLSPKVECIGGIQQIVHGVATLSISASFSERSMGINYEGHAGLETAVAALLKSRAEAGEPVVALEAKSSGMCLPPRAMRISSEERRKMKGLLLSLETEGTAAPRPPQPLGLSKNLVLGEYQLETLGWLLARERSGFGMEDLFETTLGADTVVTSLPSPRERHDWGPRLTKNATPAEKAALDSQMAAQRELATLKTTVDRQSRPRHRGGILGEEMGMGKTIELLSLILSNRAPAGWGQASVDRREATLVIVPGALVGQWRLEVEEKAPVSAPLWQRSYVPLRHQFRADFRAFSALQALEVIEWPQSMPRPNSTDAKRKKAVVILATYDQASDIAARGFEFWRVCVDEPHCALVARPSSGRIDVAAVVEHCASIRAGLRWCVTGTPFSNSLYEVYGQLVFLGLMGASDIGRQGVPRVIPALHFRGVYHNCLPSMYNSTAETVITVLKPLVVRHTKTQERSGRKLLQLKPTQSHTVRVVCSEEERAGYLQARTRAQHLAVRLHCNEHKLRCMLQPCSGRQFGKVAELEAARIAGLGARAVSRLDGCLADNMHAVALPERDDFEPRAALFPDQMLRQWRDSIDLSTSELECANCLGRLVRPATPVTCGHLMCDGCIRALLATATTRGDTISREDRGITITGAESFPASCRRSKHERERVAELLKKQLRNIAPDSNAISCSVRVFGESISAVFSLDTREQEEKAICSLNGMRIFGDDALAPVKVERVSRSLVTVPCPSPECGRRFASSDVLNLHEDVLSHQDNQPWATIVREFVAAHAIRQRRRATSHGSCGRKAVGAVSSLKRKANAIADGARTKRQASTVHPEHVEKLRATAVRLETQVQAGDFSPSLLRELANVKESLSLQQPCEASSAVAAVPYATDNDAERIDGFVPSKYVSIERVMTQLRSRGERAVVFCETIEQVEALVSFLSAKGTVQSAGITDRVKRADKEASVRALQQGKLDCLVASIRSGAVGLNLTSASHVMFMTPCLDPAIRLQCIGRCHRIGQASTVVVHTFVLEGTIEGTNSCRLQMRKQCSA